MVKILIALIFFAGLATSVALVFEFDTPKHKRQETITILRGENVFQIANDLKAEGYVSSKVFFVYEVLATGNFKKLKAGEYAFEGESQRRIIDKLASGETLTKSVTVVPGWDISDVANELKGSGVEGWQRLEDLKAADLKRDFDFLGDAPGNAGLEGYLYPDTYQTGTKQTATDLARTMLGNFGTKLSPQLRQEILAQGKNVADVLNMAAMLEKEVKTLADKRTVAGILWKRLDAKMPLQVDSTLLYYKAGTAGAIDKESESPYNTYRYSGLPAGPICNPGIESITAAVEPAESPYWYYLSAKDGTTVFAKNYGDHLINKAKYIDN
jgi:UPF0755 protein